jgi:uncharacterized protein (TIGR02145 family)
MATYKFVCSNNPEHLFEEATADFWCPLCDISTRPMLNKYEESQKIAVPENLQPEPQPAEPPKKGDIKDKEANLVVKPNPKPEIQEVPEILIGNQLWMRRFLATKQLRNKEEIFHAKNEQDWKMAKEKRMPAWCYPNNDVSLGDRFGLLYNFYAVNHPDELAPEGWSIPTMDDAKQLSVQHANLFLSEHLKYSQERVISHRMAMGSFVECGRKRVFWTRSNKVVYTAYTFSVQLDLQKIELNLFDKNAGFFVRCIKK